MDPVNVIVSALIVGAAETSKELVKDTYAALKSLIGKLLHRKKDAPDPIAIARMKYEQENYIKPGMMAPFWGVFRKSPDVNLAAKSGNPAVTSLRPSIPVSVPSAELSAGGATADIQVGTVGPNSALDTPRDARA